MSEPKIMGSSLFGVGRWLEHARHEIRDRFLVVAAAPMDLWSRRACVVHKSTGET